MRGRRRRLDLEQTKKGDNGMKIYDYDDVCFPSLASLWLARGLSLTISVLTLSRTARAEACIVVARGEGRKLRRVCAFLNQGELKVFFFFL